MKKTYHRCLSMFPYVFVLTIGFAVSALPGHAQENDWSSQLASLPQATLRPGSPPTDWLLDSGPYKARVCRGPWPHSLTLENGLIRRTFLLQPNAATVVFDNLISGQTMLRAVEPEAIVTIDGRRYEVGGLKGQPDRAFIRPEWFPFLHADPQAMQFVGFEVSKPVERVKWKQVRHHAPDVVWPPKGVHLRLDFVAPPPVPDTRQPARLPSSERRRLLLEERFLRSNSAWRLFESKAHPRSSFKNEGKFGEIYTPARTAVFAERPLPKNTRLVEVTIDPGTDRSTDWGPGFALVFERKTVVFRFRPGERSENRVWWFSEYDGDRLFRKSGPKTNQLDRTKPLTLRMRLDEPHTIYCEVQQGNGSWLSCRTLRFLEPLGELLAVRIGKLGPHGGAEDAPTRRGELVRLHLVRFAAYGALRPSANTDEQSLAQRPRVSVHYELYDGVPVLAKWITVHNPGPQPFTVDRFVSERLALVEMNNWVSARPGIPIPHPDYLHVETDFAFGATNWQNANVHVVHWRVDPAYRTQVNYLRQEPCLLEVSPTYGPAQTVPPGAGFSSYHTFLLALDSTDRERRGLAVRRMYRVLAPWVTENPIMMHMTNARDMNAVRRAIDQCAEVGFEMMIFSFGSGFQIENENPAYLARWKKVAEYARGKGVELGAYSLLSSRKVADPYMIVSPPGQRPTHGRCPALTSKWGLAYFERLRRFYQQTGFSLLEHDGSYPGDVDVTPRPPLQKGIQDSRWAQWRVISTFYKWCRARGIYLNVPDFYFFVGQNKTGMGYREVNWSLPRALQLIHTRQNIYDGTWEKTPSMGWMFVPLVQYHGGGAAATVEPLHEHIDHYRRMIESNFAFGVQPCFRGHRLYDTPEVRNMVKKQVLWFKKYRDILESDIVHGHRADGRNVDWALHVNPHLDIKGMLVAFNPAGEPVQTTLRVNLYYTGLSETARVSVCDGPERTVRLRRDYTVEIPLEIAPQEMVWCTIR